MIFASSIVRQLYVMTELEREVIQLDGGYQAFPGTGYHHRMLDRQLCYFEGLIVPNPKLSNSVSPQGC